MEGWISLHRKLQDDKIWKLEKFTRGQAWVDLILSANFQPNSFDKRGFIVDVERGQLGVSKKGLADRWKWSNSKVDRFLKYLENEHKIEYQSDNVTTIITILNYDKYQDQHTKTESKSISNENQKRINNKVNKVNNDNNKKELYKEKVLNLNQEEKKRVELDKIGKYNLMVDKSQYDFLYTDDEKRELIIKVDEYINNSDRWVLKLKESTRLSKSETNRLLTQFLRNIYTEELHYRSIKQIKTHCNRWINKNKPNPNIR